MPIVSYDPRAKMTPPPSGPNRVKKSFIQGGPEKILLKTIDSFVVKSIFWDIYIFICNIIVNQQHSFINYIQLAIF